MKPPSPSILSELMQNTFLAIIDMPRKYHRKGQERGLMPAQVFLDGLLYVCLVVEPIETIQVLHMEQARIEALQAALVLGGPLHFAQGRQPGQQFPFHLLRVFHPFRPYATFCTNDVSLFGWGQLVGTRLKVIYTPDARDTLYLVDAGVAEIEIGDWRHNGWMPFSC